MEFCFIYKEVYPWRVELSWMSAIWKTEFLADKTRRLMFVVTVYQVWKTRNRILHQSKFTNSVEMVAGIRRRMYQAVLSWMKVLPNKAKLGPNC